VLLLLNQTQRLETLQSCSWTPQLATDFPSWVPDLSRPANENFRATMAASTSSAHAHFLPPNVLEVKGIHCATVSTVYSPLSSDPVTNFDVLDQWDCGNLEHHSYPTGESHSDAFATIIIRGWLKDRFPKTPRYLTFQAWKQELFDRNQKSSHPVLQFARNSYFFTTEEGYIGLSIAETKPGKRKHNHSCQR
jgi:hypothetical protein